MGLPAAWNFSSAGTNSHSSRSLSSVVLSPPGMMSPSTCVELPRQPDLDRLEAESVERLAVQVEVALEGEHTDGHAVRPSPATSRASGAGPTP